MSENPTTRTMDNPIVGSAIEMLYHDKDETGDVSFIVESQQIRAHRSVLAALSPKYKAQFYGPQPDTGDIQVQDITAAAFKEFLQFFYLEKVTLTKENIEDVLDLARQSLVDDFVKECVDFLIDILTVDNLCWIYQFSIFYDIERLKDRCESEISAKTAELFESENFKHCDPEMLVRILQIDAFRCSEIEAFDACISWARAACEAKNIDASDPVNLRTELAFPITLIRFGSMILPDFASRHRALEGFFTTEECNEVLYIIAKLDSFQPKKFTKTLRKESLPLLECNRPRKRLRIPIEHNERDGFDFQVGLPIQLHGFIIATDLVEELNVDVGINGEEWRRPTIKKRKSHNKTIVTFTEPIDIVPHELHNIRYNSSDLEKRVFQYGYPDGRVESNNITFVINNLCSDFTLVSQLLFTEA